MKALEDGPPAVAAGFGVRQTGACRTRHGLRGRRCAVTFITAGPYHEFIEAAEAAIPVVGYLYHVSFYVRGQC